MHHRFILLFLAIRGLLKHVRNLMPRHVTFFWAEVPIFFVNGDISIKKFHEMKTIFDDGTILLQQ